MKNSNNIKKSVKKILFISLLFLLIPGFAFGASTSLPDTKVKATAKPLKNPKIKKSPLQKQGSTLVNPQNTRPVLRSAEITRLLIGTESSGKWYWEVTIKNTGNVELEGQRVIAQGYKLSFSSSQNAWTGASGSIIGGNLLPDHSMVIKRYWNRCCKTDQLKVELRDNLTNSVLDTETLTSLTHSSRRPLDVRVRIIHWNNTTKSWQATLKNYTDFTVKLSVKGDLWKVNTTTLIPAGISIITIGPNGEASSAWKNMGGPQHGDKLSVRTKFLMGENYCNESDNDCGYIEFNQVTIPDSGMAFVLY